MQAIGAPCYVARMQSGRSDTRFVSVLGEIMERTGLKPQTLANATSTDPSVISRWLSGETRRPKPESVVAFAAGLVAYAPNAADLVAPLFESLGYMPIEPAEPPGIVRDNWDDETVRALWRLPMAEDLRQRLVETYVIDKTAVGIPGEPAPSEAVIVTLSKAFSTFERVIMESDMSADLKAAVVRMHRATAGDELIRRIAEEIPRSTNG